MRVKRKILSLIFCCVLTIGSETSSTDISENIKNGITGAKIGTVGTVLVSTGMCARKIIKDVWNRPPDSDGFWPMVRKVSNVSFKRIKWIGITLTGVCVIGLICASVHPAIPELVSIISSYGVGATGIASIIGLIGQKLTDEKKDNVIKEQKSNQGNKNNELLHSNFGMQSKQL